jgi:hypothetical protein
MSGARFIDHLENGQPDLSIQVLEIFLFLPGVRHIFFLSARIVRAFNSLYRRQQNKTITGQIPDNAPAPRLPCFLK